MKTLKKDQSGFGTVEIILVLVFVAILGVVGWLVYNGSHNKVTPYAATTTPTKTTTTTKPSQTPKVYFTIKEWGIRALYSGKDTLMYTLSNDKKLATVVSKQLAAKDSGCSTYGAGQISRLLPSDNAYASGDGPSVKDYAKLYPNDYTYVGGYYYRFVHDQAQCGSVSVVDENQANSVTQSLVKNFQAVPN